MRIFIARIGELCKQPLDGVDGFPFVLLIVELELILFAELRVVKQSKVSRRTNVSLLHADGLISWPILT
jgi:hypothetical protein